jgi:TfoX/Sxy family transcriptional regulator of competence genes
MFGEYALYAESKVVALVCSDTLYVKITEAGKKFAADSYQEGHAYDGAKVSMVISDELIEDRQWLSELIEITAEQLPPTKTKKRTGLK